MIFNEMKESGSDWLPYVNYAQHEKDANMVTFHTKSGVYYLTFRLIPANTELLVHDQHNNVENRKGYKRRYSESSDFPIQGNCWSESYCKRKDELQFTASKIEATAENIPLISRLGGCFSLTAETYLINGKEGKSNATNEEKSIHKGNPFQREYKHNKNGNSEFTDTNKPTAHIRKESSERRKRHEPDKNIFQNEKGPTDQKRVEMDEQRTSKGILDQGKDGTNITKELNADLKQSTHTSDIYKYIGKKDLFCKSYYTVIHNSRKPSLLIRTSENLDSMEKQYGYGKKLKQHPTVHIMEKHYKNNQNGKECPTRCQLKLQESLHPNKECLDCNIHKGKCDQKSYPTIERKIHSGEKTFDCTICRKKFVRSYLNVHKITQTAENPFACNACGKILGTKNSLNGHHRLHSGEKQFQCNACGKKFLRGCKLTVHERIHMSEKPFHCNNNSEECTDRGTLNRHERIHTAQKPFECNAYGNKFTQKSNLITQETIHTGQKPFECNACGKKFARRNHLTVHERTHTGQKPFECSACGKKFARRGDLTVHERIHTGQKPFECNICGKKFAGRNSLIVHEIIHTGQRPFECKACGKKFARRNDLTVHERIHTGQKPFECNVCGKKFTQRGHLITHENIHTGQKPF